MATFLDQTENVPVLNNSTEQHSDNSTLESSQSRQSDSRSSEGKSNDDLRLLFPDRFWSIAAIVVGFVVAVALAVCHHTYLHYLRGRNIEEFPQVWIKGANNGFSNIFSIFVGLSAGSALTQIKWRASGSEPLQMYTIDNLFALPSPLALLKILMRPRGSLFFPILSSVLIQALVLVSILAPSALTVGPSEQVSRDIEVPMFNLSQGHFAAGGMKNASMTYEWLLDSLQLTGEERINSVLFNLPELTWAIPQDCGFKCAFYFIYTSPGLECHDVIHGSPPVPLGQTTPSGGPCYGCGPDSLCLSCLVYQASSNLYLQNLTVVDAPYFVDAPYDLSINYTGLTEPIGANLTVSPAAGTYCRFYQATYNASFELNSESSTQRASTSIISHGEYLSWGKTGAKTTSFDELDEKGNWWAVCYAFALAFQGDFQFYDASYNADSHPIIASIFNVNQSTNTFELGVSNLSQTVADLFSNLTLGLMSIQGSQDTVIAQGITWDGSSVWIYTAWILWAAYLPAVILAVAVALYGLYTIHMSGIAMDDGFSSFLLATQNAELSEICRKAAAFDELQRLQLIHEKNGTFVVVDSSLKSPN